MDNYKHAYYEAIFERDFLKKKGTEFQSFFLEIMEKRYPGDFIRVRPWGMTGDRKCDGYLKSTRTLFQLYAPNEMEARKTIAKMEEDYTGALPYWEQYFNEWVFVHNARDGLGPDVTTKLLELGQRNANIRVTAWGFEEIRNTVFELTETDLVALLGPAPSQRDIVEVGFEDLRLVLDHIGAYEPAASEDIRPVPSDKLAANALSPSVAALLKIGMTKSDAVGAFFAKWHDASLGDRIARAFKKRYLELRSQGLQPDKIFWGLQAFACGDRRSVPKHEAAVLAVMAYLFEVCDIFEEGRQPA